MMSTLKKPVVVVTTLSMTILWSTDATAQNPLDDGRFVVVKNLGPGVNSVSCDFPGSESDNGRTFYFESMRPSTGGVVATLWEADLYRATRNNRSERFDGAELLTALETPQADALPFLFSDETGTRIYFSSTRPGLTDWDIWEADVRADGSIGDPRPLGPTINGTDADAAVTMPCDGSELLFLSDRGDSNDIWAAPRVGDGFGEPINLGPVEGHLVNDPQASESFPSISCDGQTLFFSDMTAWTGAWRPDAPESDELWVSRREDGLFEEPINLGELGDFLSTRYCEWTPVIGIDWPANGSVLRFASDRPHPLAHGEFDIYEVTWLMSGAGVDTENEAPRTRGAINCGGLEVDAREELGFVFEEDRFSDDETHYTGDEASGFTVYRSAFGRVYDDSISRGENPQPIDVSRIAGAGAEAVKLFATDTRSEGEIHYRARVVPGRYLVTLYFAAGSVEAADGLAEDGRFITASLNGEEVLCDWSTSAAAGRVTCEVIPDSAVARSFSLDVRAEEQVDAHGLLNVQIVRADDGDTPAEPYLSALSFERMGDATGDPISGQIECSQRCVQFKRGDANGDGAVNLTDAVSILGGLFGGNAALGCRAAEDTNGDGGVNLTDAVHLLQSLFRGGEPPVEPFPECGFGTLESDNTLGCANPPSAC